MEQTPPPHFAGKNAIQHVTQNLARGMIASSEIHGTEIPGAISSGSDSAKESVFLYGLLFTLLLALEIPKNPLFISLLALSFGWILWKTGRSAFLGWARLERLHRIATEEKWEIDHNREQERDELTALYRAKGFEGKLLSDVIDVLMSDGDLLLRVMLEEELGLTLDNHEHPLKQALGAFIGSSLSLILCGISSYFLPFYGFILVSLLIITFSSYIEAKYQQNAYLEAIVWNLGIFLAAFGSFLSLLEYLKS